MEINWLNNDALRFFRCSPRRRGTAKCALHPLMTTGRTKVLFVAFAIALLMTPIGHAAEEVDEASSMEEKTTETNSAYRIGPGDELEILVWREPDVSRTVQVRPDGRISLPLVDDIQAAGKTPLELKRDISEALASFVDNPSVYVLLQGNGSKKIYVLGKVQEPGEFILEKRITVLQAIALAGGFVEWAKKDDIVIVRNQNGEQERLEFDFDDVISGDEIEKNIELIPDDVVVVP